MSLSGRSGYIETKLGWVPGSWECVSQAEVVTFNNGRAYKLTEWETEGTPVIRLQNLTGSGDTFYYSKLELPPHQYVQKGDLLFMWSATFGPRIWQGNKAIYHYHIWKIDCSARVDRSYMFHSLSKFTDEMKNKTNGSTMLHLTKAGMEKEVIALPPLREQQKIAAILTAVDDKLDVIARQIEATQALKQGMMQTLFSRGVGTQGADGRWVPHSEFKVSEGRMIPEAWGVGTLSAYVSALRSGVSVNAEDRAHGEGEIGVLKVSCVQGGKFLPSNHKTVIPDELTRVAEPVQQGCIIISRANTPALVGESAYIDESWGHLFLPDKLWQTEPTEMPHSVRWLSFYLQSLPVRQEIRKAATGTSGSMKNISKVALLGLFMPLVPLAEQMRIAELLMAITAKVDALESKRMLYQSVKRGLTQKLLTGEWRVKLDANIAA